MFKIPAEKRSKSLCSLENDCGKEAGFCDYRRGSQSVSESSVEVCGNYESDTSSDRWKDSGVESEVMGVLERKMDRLSDLFLEQCRLLTEIKSDIRTTTSITDKTEQTQNLLLIELLKKALNHSKSKEIEDGAAVTPSNNFSSRARLLLNAIETSKFSLDREIRDALVEFLQSEDLKHHIVASTVDSVRDMIRCHFTRDVSRIYLPILERSQRRLAKTITRSMQAAFMKLEENSSFYSNSIYKITSSLRHALERHESLIGGNTSNLQSQVFTVIEDVLQVELQQWRAEALKALCEEEPSTPEEDPDLLDYSPLTPTQPADQESSIIDQLMIRAEINKYIEDGDINLSFEKALSAGDLALVMAACRAADPRLVFSAPCKLTQAVLLSLTQQLATDMLHESQLKCRYLEEALLSLNPADSATRSHLPAVVSDVRTHLTDFLHKYPSHVSNKRIMLIIMAADNLLK